MKKSVLLTALLASTFLSAPLVAHAEDGTDSRDVIRSSNGTIVTNSFGECVRTSWDVGGDACGPAAVTEANQETTETKTVQPTRHTEVGEEQRTIHFAFNKSDLTAESKAKLDSLTEVLKSADDVKAAKIVGYADRIGSIAYNDKLSQARAEAVKDYIVAHGYAKATVAETRWVGKTEPITACPANMKRSSLIECLQPDRRVEVELEYQEVVSTNDQPTPDMDESESDLEN